MHFAAGDGERKYKQHCSLLTHLVADFLRQNNNKKSVTGENAKEEDIQGSEKKVSVRVKVIQQSLHISTEEHKILRGWNIRVSQVYHDHIEKYLT